MGMVIQRAILIGLTVCSGVLAQAQNQFEGSDIVVTGPNPPFDGWPGVNATPALQLKNDGTSGDVTAGDGLYSVDFATSDSTKNIGDLIEWKVKQSNSWSASWPSSGNGYVRAQEGSTKYIFDTTQRNDGYKPDPDGSTVKGFLYTLPAPVQAGDVVRVVGSVISEIGGADWTPNDNAGLMNDAGTGGDVAANDGIYTLQFTGVPAASYDFKVVVNATSSSGPWTHQAGAVGYSTDAGNFALTVFASSDTIKIEFDSAKGRTKISNSNPMANPGPPFFGCSPAWSTALDTTTELNDAQANGDVTAGDGIYSRIFTVATPGNYGLKVKQGVGPEYPDSGTLSTNGGYPINTTTPNQQVLVQFDTNVKTDGYLPNTRYVWVDPASRFVTTYVQPVGDFMMNYGSGGDWNNGDTLFQLVDNGTNGDVTAGDQVWANTFTVFTANSGRVWKALGQQGSWDIQYGSSGEGLTRFGNNEPNMVLGTGSPGQNTIFVVDAVTGRAAAFVNTAATAISRPATINAAATSSVADWTIY